MLKNNENYQQLIKLSKKGRLFESIESLLHWDQETYMPHKGIGLRSEQLELVASLGHAAKTNDEWEKLLSTYIDLERGTLKNSSLDFSQQACIKSWRRDFLLAKALPNAFVKEFAKLNSEAMSVWGEAREKDDFSLFAPYLQKTIELSRRKANYINPKAPLYDTLIDYHEPEMTALELEGYFTQLKEGLLPLLNKIKESKQLDNSFLHGSFPKEKQMEFSNLLLKKVGFDHDCGRLDLSRHPFSMSLHPFDSRITTRINKTGLFESLSAVLHEVGHSFYEMDFDEKSFGTPLCQAISLGIHESQSRFYETYVGQNKAFWSYFFPKLQEFFHLKEISLEQFYRAINKVEPSLIRVESDEVTYTFHVIIRFEIEKALLEGSLQVKDLPDVWNEKMKNYLGIVPHSAKEGCLQDIHWSMGEFGYFPTYSLGNLYGAQFFATFTENYPDWQKRFEQGEFLFVREWLKEQIHIHGRTYSAKELVKKVTGKPLSTHAYLNYLTFKYGTLYKMQ